MLEQIISDFKEGKENHFRGVDGLTDSQVKWMIERIHKLEDENRKVNKGLEEGNRILAEMNSENITFRKKNGQYEQALEMYADINNYTGKVQWITLDQGEFARQTLGKLS